MFQPAEHWTQWIAQKSRKSHFRNTVNRSSYSPKTNTAVIAEYEESLKKQAEVPVEPTPAD